MADVEAQHLIAAAKADIEACDQLEFWIAQLRSAIQARHLLLDLPPDQLKAALEAQR